ncbi:winged helix-turn-helix domain-containing protein [Liquorilactobacillus mali]|uniref:Uncharacterized protein n=1 Tax=Liquorilactobacillus mali KCTC 3596 = DSM 20444 TaxID=1046596 RepID=A0A0R2E290_9LACO|nr:helix-turn-helix domain-containing protein [Liquorilactobacillus mali]KRN10401.1 hypothetical protein FD00_GL000166 [Liquorilactobacillus mali KCTC 3596 = DSM 20444]MDV7758088.1 winged helix-turn-helix transcriptional regulator [Liquorilactobacillus mali]
MAANIVSQLARALADEKNIKIIKTTNVQDGINIKEISKKTGIPTSQLYYPIKKLVDLELIEIVRSEHIKNLQEYYYSSFKLNDHNGASSIIDDDKINGLNMSADWAAEHTEELVKMFLYGTQLFIDSATKEINEYKKDSSYFDKIKTGGVFSTLKLSQEAQKKLFADIYKLLNEAEEKDQGTDKEEINFMVQKW